MQPTRIARLQSAILEELSTVLPREVKDPRVPPITITRVELSPDAGMARVYFMLMGSMPTEDPEETKERDRRVRECVQGLVSASGFLKRHLARVLRIRQTPDLTFQEDRGLENTLRVHQLLSKIAEEKKPDEGGEPTSGSP
jgi:ribosome-binding factor A